MQKKIKKCITSLLFANMLWGTSGHAAIPCDSCKSRTGEVQLCAPIAVNGFEPIDYPDTVVAQNLAYRHTLLAGYNRAESRLAITFYLYDRVVDSDAEDINETAFAVREILSAHRGSRFQMGGRTTLSIGGEMTRGHNALLNWREGAEDYASFVWIMPLDKRFMKIRATYVRPTSGEGEAMTSTLNAVKAIADQVCR